MSTLSRLIEPFWTREFVANHLWKFIGVVTLGLLLLAATLDLDLVAELVIVVGWFLLLPIFLFFGEQIATTVFDEDETNANVKTSDSLEANDSLETIRDRYARGELTESEFEQRIERLLETGDGAKSADGPARSGRRNERASSRGERESASE